MASHAQRTLLAIMRADGVLQPGLVCEGLFSTTESQHALVGANWPCIACSKVMISLLPINGDSAGALSTRQELLPAGLLPRPHG
jgi:hypothetical protein